MHEDGLARVPSRSELDVVSRAVFADRRALRGGHPGPLGASVGEVLNNVKSNAPGIETRLFKAPNQLNRFVNIYLNDEDIRFLKNLETPVKEGDEISIVPAIAGGR